MRRVLEIALSTFFVLSISIFVINLVLGVGLFFPNQELPLHDVQQIKCHNNQIYVGLGFYSRVQVYESDGRYLKSFRMSNNSKPYSFWVDSNGVPSARVGGLIAYDEKPKGSYNGKYFTLTIQCSSRILVRQSILYFALGGIVKSAFYLGAAIIGMLILAPRPVTRMSLRRSV